MVKFADDAELIRQLALQRAQQHDQKAFQNDVEYVEDLVKLQTTHPKDDPLCLPGGPETFQTASADKPPEDVKEEKSDAECKFLYNSITESAAGILVGFKLKCHHPYMDRLPQMEEIVRTYESMMRLMIHLYELRNHPGDEAERKSRFESCKQVFEELKEGWQELLFCDATARLDR